MLGLDIWVRVISYLGMVLPSHTPQGIYKYSPGYACPLGHIPPRVSAGMVLFLRDMVGGGRGMAWWEKLMEPSKF